MAVARAWLAALHMAARVLCWVDRPADRGLLLDAVNTAVYNGLSAAGITIPFPQRDVHLKGLPGAGSLSAGRARPGDVG